MPRDAKSAAAAIVSTAILVAAALPAAAAGGPGGGVPPPADVPPARAPAWQGFAGGADPAEVNLGAGHLAPVGPPPDAGVSWVEGISLPVYENPDGDLSGWSAHGWWVPASGGDNRSWRRRRPTPRRSPRSRGAMAWSRSKCAASG